jgi:hypothetical protein
MSRLSRSLAILTMLVSGLILFAVPRWSQDPAYHNFADQAVVFGIPHFFDVTSNLPFILIGFWGWWKSRVHSVETRGLWSVFAISVLLTGLGSIWYHLNPNHDTLLWDRLPMSVGFVAFFLLVAHRYMGEPWIDKIKAGALILAPATVLWWWTSEKMGQGDLRPYALIQALPLVLVLVIISVRKGDASDRRSIVTAVLIYAVAKVFEFNDGAIHATNGYISGHTIKHLLAGYSCWLLLR